VLVATHDAEFAAAFAERVVLLADGRPIADGPAPSCSRRLVLRHGDRPHPRRRGRRAAAEEGARLLRRR
jgi:energy-coupling factor transporter ATP-binding protein EcfA2